MNKGNRCYIITGIFGHLGNTIARILLKSGEKVVGLALPNETAVSFLDENGEEYDVFIIRGNVCDKKSLLPLFEVANGYETVVIHTAGIVTISSHFNQLVHDVNVTGTKNMLELSAENNVARFIHVSSVHAIPAIEQDAPLQEILTFDPDKVEGLYAKTKAEATGLVLDFAKKGLSASVVHPSGIIGPYDFGRGHITQLVIDYLKGRLTACVEGGYDFVDVRDVANGILACVDKGESESCYILSNRLITVKDLLDGLHLVSGRKEIKTVLPMWFAKLTAPLSEIYYKIRKQPPLYTSYSLYTLCANANFSHQKATATLGYSPRCLEETLRDTVSFLRKSGKVP